MTDMVKVTVRLPRETHRRVKVRAAAEGVAMEALGRAFFEGYAGGNGLSAGEVGPGQGAAPVGATVLGAESALPTAGDRMDRSPAERPFQPDWKKGKE